MIFLFTVLFIIELYLFLAILLVFLHTYERAGKSELKISIHYAVFRYALISTAIILKFVEKVWALPYYMDYVWYTLILLAFFTWSISSYIKFYLASSYGFRGSAFEKKISLERHVDEFFRGCGYKHKKGVKLQHLIEKRLITHDGTLAEGVTTKHMLDKGYIVELDKVVSEFFVPKKKRKK